MSLAVFGKHLIVDAAGCNERIRDGAAIAAFSRRLVEAIDMKAFGEPIVEHFGHDDPKTSGYSLVQLIETSNITAHFCDFTGEAYFDIFSCKDFDAEIALGVIREHFAPSDYHSQFMTRQAPRVAAMAQTKLAG